MMKRFCSIWMMLTREPFSQLMDTPGSKVSGGINNENSATPSPNRLKDALTEE
jgi:hypothetical protein